MPKPLPAILTQIDEGKPPRVLLIGGSSDFLAEQAFHHIRHHTDPPHQPVRCSRAQRLVPQPGSKHAGDTSEQGHRGERGGRVVRREQHSRGKRAE